MRARSGASAWTVVSPSRCSSGEAAASAMARESSTSVPTSVSRITRFMYAPSLPHPAAERPHAHQVPAPGAHGPRAAPDRPGADPPR